MGVVNKHGRLESCGRILQIMPDGVRKGNGFPKQKDAAPFRKGRDGVTDFIRWKVDA